MVEYACTKCGKDVKLLKIGSVELIEKHSCNTEPIKKVELPSKVEKRDIKFILGQTLVEFTVSRYLDGFSFDMIKDELGKKFDEYKVPVEQRFPSFKSLSSYKCILNRQVGKNTFIKWIETNTRANVRVNLDDYPKSYQTVGKIIENVCRKKQKIDNIIVSDQDLEFHLQEERID